MTGRIFRCTECKSLHEEQNIDMLKIEHPVTGEHVRDLPQCRNCGDVDCFEPICDEPGCTAAVTCGWPTKSGYRNTCSQHYVDQTPGEP